MRTTRELIVDEKGQAKAVILSIEEYRRLLERVGDAEELALIEQRRAEPDLFVSSVDELNGLLAGD